MKKILKPVIVVLLSLAVFFILHPAFPKYSGILILLLVYLILTLYLWSGIVQFFKKPHKKLRTILKLVFWSPPLLLLCLIVLGFFYPFRLWPVILKAEVVSLLIIASISALIPISGLLLTDLHRIFLFLKSCISKKDKKKYHEIIRKKCFFLITCLLGSFLFLLLFSGMIWGRYNFITTENHVSLKRLPSSFKGFRIVQISDIHLGSWLSKKKLSEAISRIKKLKPDIIVFTGDMFNYSTADGNGYQEILKKLSAPMGVFCVLGNHDYGDYIIWKKPDTKEQNMKDLVSYYHQIGWKLLRNENIILYKGYDSIALIGVENWGATHRFQRLGDIAKASQGTENILVKILLSHDPTYWDSIISREYPEIGLTLSGHTHGGQIGIEGLGIHWCPVSIIYPHCCGLYQNPDHSIQQYINVNKGLGTIGYTGRIGMRPEISLIILE